MANVIESPYLNRLAKSEQKFGIVSASELVTFENRVSQYGHLALAMRQPTPLMSFKVGGATIWAKVESANPFSESHYDRVTLAVLRTLEQENLLKPGMKILEGTSGSAGRSFAYFCNKLGFELDMIIPQELPWQRRRDMVALGANLIETEKLGGVREVIRKYRRTLVQLRRDSYEEKELTLEGKPISLFTKGDEVICAPNHSEIEITPRAFKNIAYEVARQVPSDVRIDTFIGTLGNGSTIKGISEGLKEKFGEDVRVIGTETRHAPVNAIRKLREEVGEELLAEEFMKRYGFRMPIRQEMTYHDSYGASTPGYEPPFVEVENIDQIVLLQDEWRELKRRYNERSYKYFQDENTLGNTSAENLWVAEQIALRPQGRGRNILVLFYDKADQYPGWPPDVYRLEAKGLRMMADYVDELMEFRRLPF